MMRVGRVLAHDRVFDWQRVRRCYPLKYPAIVFRVRAKFVDMLGLRLTLPQAPRFWGLEPPG